MVTGFFGGSGVTPKTHTETHKGFNGAGVGVIPPIHNKAGHGGLNALVAKPL